MAQPTSCGVVGDGTDSVCVAATSTSAQSLVLDSSLVYDVVHDGEDAASAVDNNTILLGTGTAAPVADGSAEVGKYKLTPGAAVRVGPRVGKLWFIVAAGAPTFSITANELRR